MTKACITASAIGLLIAVHSSAKALDKPKPEGAEAGEAAAVEAAPPAADEAAAPDEPTAAEATPAAPEAAEEPADPQPLPPPPAPQYQQLGEAAAAEPETQEGEWDPWEHVKGSRVHEGFFLRLSLGFGYGSMHGDGGVDSGLDEITYSGAAFAANMQVGGAIFDNFILHLDIFNSWLLGPDVEETSDFDVRDFDEDVRMPGFGIGASYYFMPHNIYLTGSLGLGQVAFTGPNGDSDGSDVGFAANVMVGKEWWVGRDWGLGLAGQFMLVTGDDDVLYGKVSGIAINGVMSATYN